MTVINAATNGASVLLAVGVPSAVEKLHSSITHNLTVCHKAATICFDCVQLLTMLASLIMTKAQRMLHARCVNLGAGLSADMIFCEPVMSCTAVSRSQTGLGTEGSALNQDSSVTADWQVFGCTM